MPVANNPHSKRQPVDDRDVLGTVAQIMSGVAPWVSPSQWAVDQLAIGGQAWIYTVRKHDGSVICGGAERELIVKVFKPTLPELRAAVDVAFDSLSHISRELDGARIGAWRIRCPVPLQKSHAPHALVMTPVPGRSVNHLLADAEFGESELLHDSLIPCVAEALARFWQGSRPGETRIYGDMNLFNVLCDPDTRMVSFVDCGMPDRFWLCEGVSRNFSPASRDLGYLLYSSASAVRASLGKPQLRRRELRIVRQLMRACVELVAATPRQRQGLLDEVADCARWHAAGIQSSASPAGLWRGVVKRAAHRCINRIIGDVRDGLLKPMPARAEKVTA
jgi:hypothetical protein